MNIEDMQHEGKIEMTIVLGFIHINGKAVQHHGHYVEPRHLVEDTRLVIDLGTSETQSPDQS